jgi:hypothetical protein
MFSDISKVEDSVAFAMDRGVPVLDGCEIEGIVTLELCGPDGALKERRIGRNLITDAGDLYHAQKVITAIAPASASAPTAMTGMKLGTGTTAAAKSGAGGALVTYLTASNQAFDATYPQTSNLGAGLGVTAKYRVTYAAGTATNTALTEVVIVNDAATNATSTAANTLSRYVFSAINKGASDTLTVTWDHKFLGA